MSDDEGLPDLQPVPPVEVPSRSWDEVMDIARPALDWAREGLQGSGMRAEVFVGKNIAELKARRSSDDQQALQLVMTDRSVRALRSCSGQH